ncbi:MAG: alpha/beta fold hydrolase [Alphaproteobacteria bacterium]|nr:alpha/beta fold hydrolase [Alphaproteobacteria bacterium]
MERDVGVAGLHGTLILPDKADYVPGVLILAGSGPVDRDGNVPGAENNSLKLLARGLAARGVASLRADKRGVGGSLATETREEDLRFSTYVDDAEVLLNYLCAEERISRAFLLGHSEGALVATLVAQRAEISGLILIAGAGRPAAQVIESQLSAPHVSASLLQASSRIAAKLEQQMPVADIPTELSGLYRPSMQNYLMSWFPINPARELAKTRCPVLIVQGGTDLQTGFADAQLLARARPESKLVLIAGMNHVLKQSPMERTANLQTYAAPDLPLAPELLSAIEDFLQ